MSQFDGVRQANSQARKVSPPVMPVSDEPSQVTLWRCSHGLPTLALRAMTSPVGPVTLPNVSGMQGPVRIDEGTKASTHTKRIRTGIAVPNIHAPIYPAQSFEGTAPKVAHSCMQERNPDGVMHATRIAHTLALLLEDATKDLICCNLIIGCLSPP